MNEFVALHVIQGKGKGIGFSPFMYGSYGVEEIY
jgi:hypothetical protein